MTNVSLGIVIPVYQSAPTIFRALQSVLTARDFSPAAKKLPLTVVCVMDGEDLESEKIIERFDELAPIPVTVIGKPHTGVSNTRNVGIAALTTSHVTFLDADDEVTGERLEIAAHSPEGLVVSRQKIIYDRPSPRPAGIGAGSPPSHYFTSMVAPLETIRTLGGFDESMHSGPDVDLVIRARDAGFPVDMVQTITTIRHVTGYNASLDTAASRQDLLRSLLARRI